MVRSSRASRGINHRRSSRGICTDSAVFDIAVVDVLSINDADDPSGHWGTYSRGMRDHRGS